MSDQTPKQSGTPVLKDELDIGPLSWVKPEIQFALTRADEGITAYSANPAEHDLIKTTLPHVHQVTGALRMVGLEPITLISGAIEKLIEALSRGGIDGRRAAGAIRDALKALSRYLDGLMRGDRNRPLALYPTYRALFEALGPDPASPIDLFYPNFSGTPKFSDGPTTQRGPALNAFMALKRAEFQKGLLQLLRGADYSQTLSGMSVTLSSIESVQPAETRILWWIAAGFLEGLAKSTKAPGQFQKQLCGRIDLEIKRQAEGSNRIPERLLRELLFAIAYMPPTTPRLREIHTAYRLLTLLPSASQESPESTRVKVPVHDIQGQLEMVKDTWLSFTSGNQASLNQFANETAQLNNFAQSFKSTALRRIFAKLAEVGNDLLVNPRTPGEALSLEVATLLLTARDALDSYAQLGPNFNTMTQTAVLRVNAALKGRPLPGSREMQLLDLRRSPQDKKLFAQLGQEIIGNLNLIEETLDAFFRNPDKRAELTKLPKSIKQVQGALAILESKDAVNLLEATSKFVLKFISQTEPVDPADAELTAEAVSYLGLFVAAIQQGYENPEEILKPALDRLGLKAAEK